MYVYPYGDSQQLNLDWIINKLKELEEREISTADLEEIANAFIALTHSSGTQYRRYDYCYYQGKLYRALNDNIGAFNASDWMEVRLGDDIPVLTRLINAIDAAAVVDVTFDTSGTNGKLQQKYNNTYHDVVEVDYTPVQNSKRPLSSHAGYLLNAALTNIGSFTTASITTQVDALESGEYVGTVTGNTTGLPVASAGVIRAIVYNANYKRIYYYQNGVADVVYVLAKIGGTWQSTWTMLPTRNDITTLETALTPTPITSVVKEESTVTDNTHNVYKMGRLALIYFNIDTSTSLSSNTNLFSGLPGAVTTWAFIGEWTEQNQLSGFYVTNGGYLRNSGALAAGHWNIIGTYITDN